MRRSLLIGLLLISVAAVATLAGPIPITDLTDALDDPDRFDLADPNSATEGGTDPIEGPTPTLATDTAAAGITGTASTVENADGRRDLSNPPVTVAVRNTAAPDRDLTAVVADALAYWNANRQFGAYETEFILRPNASDPDVIVWYNQTTNCESEGSIGCAPKLDDDPQVETPLSVQIEYNRTRNRRQDTMTIIHEFGHVLGIDHCEPPEWVMGHAGYCGGAGVSLPDIDDRAFPWRGSTVLVYVDLSRVPGDERTETRRQIGHAIQYFRDGANGTVPANRSIVAVDDPYLADISITAGADCGDSDSVCYNQWGGDPDSDGVYEFYTKGEVSIAAEDVETRGWYAGWALARLLTPGDTPSVFVDPTYEEIKSDWWNQD